MKNKRFMVLTISPVALILIAIFILRGSIVDKLVGNVILKSGKPMKFGSYTIFIDRIEDNKLLGIKITSKDRKVEAKSGAYEYMPKENALKFNLIDGSAYDVDSKNPAKFYRLMFKTYFIKIRLNRAHPR